MALRAANVIRNRKWSWFLNILVLTLSTLVISAISAWMYPKVVI